MFCKIFNSLLLLVFSTGLLAQQPSGIRVPEGKPDTKHIRIVDTLTALEKTTRNPIILKTEFDSLIRLFNISQVQPVVKEPVHEAGNNNYRNIMTGLFGIIALLLFVIYLFFRHRMKINRTIASLKEKAISVELNSGNELPGNAKEKNSKVKTISTALESKISDINAELHRLTRENEGLNRVIKEYNGINHEYDSLKHGILKTYKVKNYPGYDNSKDELLAMQGVFLTEKFVANYAFEKFMKPILAITDANKNSPARLSEEDRETLLDLLVSQSLMYMEYLYLRVNDLSVGGKIVERMQQLGKGNGLDFSLLKKLNTEFGSRALVLKITLSKAGMHQLSYPVFDDTNLNNL